MPASALLPQAVSHPVIVSISGCWAPLICRARTVVSALTPVFASRVSLISTACLWWGSIPWTNITSASLNSAVVLALPLAEGAGDMGAALELWFMPPMSGLSLFPQAARPRVRPRVRAVKVALIAYLLLIRMSLPTCSDG